MRKTTKKSLQELERNILLFLAVVIVGFALFTGLVLWSKSESVRGTDDAAYGSMPAAPQLPPELANLIGFHFVKPYHIAIQPIAGTAVLYTATFDTKHLVENYRILKNTMVHDRGFQMMKDVQDGGLFFMGFSNGSDRLEIESVGTLGSNEGSITLRLYKKS